MVQVLGETLWPKRFYLDKKISTFKNERLQLAIHPLLQTTFTFYPLFLHLLKTALQLPLCCLNPSAHCPLQPLLIVFLIIDFPLDIPNHFHYPWVLLCLIFLPLKELVLFLVELGDQRAMHLGFAELRSLLETVESLKQSRGCFLILVFSLLRWGSER